MARHVASECTGFSKPRTLSSLYKVPPRMARLLTPDEPVEVRPLAARPPGRWTSRRQMSLNSCCSACLLSAHEDGPAGWAGSFIAAASTPHVNGCPSGAPSATVWDSSAFTHVPGRVRPPASCSCKRLFKFCPPAML